MEPVGEEELSPPLRLSHQSDVNAMSFGLGVAQQRCGSP
jgi:hypothetical protein